LVNAKKIHCTFRENQAERHLLSPVSHLTGLEFQFRFEDTSLNHSGLPIHTAPQFKSELAALSATMQALVKKAMEKERKTGRERKTPSWGKGKHRKKRAGFLTNVCTVC
jgi:hypothetical protein